jgi:cystathionine gamma-synthase
MSKMTPETWLVTAGRPEEAGSPLNVPLMPASNFIIGAGREYARDGATPGWEALEEIIGGLEGGQSVAFSSGMAAAAAVFDQLGAGAEIVLPDDCYQGVVRLAECGVEKGLWQMQRLAVGDTGAWLQAAGNADLLWLESPSNPLLTVADVRAICAAPRKAGAILAVDNTFATPLNQQPLALGADVSMQSATKFIGGHSDLLAGILSTDDAQLAAAFRESRTLGGATPGTLESWLAVRGLRTLALRLEKAQASAGSLSQFLEQHPAVERVRYPGLSSHPTHEIAATQLGGYGTIISFELSGGPKEAAAVCTKLKLIRHATSLGAVESTIERRAAVKGQEHIPPSLLRLSVGVEACIDLQADLEQALAGLMSV